MPYRYKREGSSSRSFLERKETDVDDGTPSTELSDHSLSLSYSSSSYIRPSVSATPVATDREGGGATVRRVSRGQDKGEGEHCLNSWRPLLLFVPLRLGLTDINNSYIDPIKECFHLEETMGIIGGRPNSAYYFIGYQGSFLLYLDPHDTRPCVSSVRDDSSYHCDWAKRMPFSALDPSLAIGFLLQSQQQFDTWCSTLRKNIITDKKQPLFEVVQKRPSHWPPLEIYPSLSPHPQNTIEDMAASFLKISEREIDDDFVIL